MTESHPAAAATAPMRPAPSVSMAVPLFNEEENLPELYRRVAAVAAQLEGGPHELILVDDGSSDRTPEMIQELEATPSLRLVKVLLSRNFGHQTALTAAIDHARGDVLVLMDGDLQDPPELVFELIARYREGWDVVYVRRAKRDVGWHLNLAYKIFYRTINALSDIALPLDSGDFSLMARPVVDAIRRSPEQHRYLRGLRTWAGFRQLGIEAHRPARLHGETKYSLLRLLRLATDGIFAFSSIPLRFATLLGALAVGLSLLFTAYALYSRFVLERVPEGFTATLLVVVFLAGVQMLFLGIIGEYVGRIYEEVKGRPHYITRAVERCEAPASGPAGA
jgi:glycosyltransferase involved in cell wall biosynthesis